MKGAVAGLRAGQGRSTGLADAGFIPGAATEGAFVVTSGVCGVPRNNHADTPAPSRIPLITDGSNRLRRRGSSQTGGEFVF